MSVGRRNYMWLRMRGMRRKPPSEALDRGISKARRSGDFAPARQPRRVEALRAMLPPYRVASRLFPKEGKDRAPEIGRGPQALSNPMR
jgi:hypothetical protein